MAKLSHRLANGYIVDLEKIVAVTAVSDASLREISYRVYFNEKCGPVVKDGYIGVWLDHDIYMSEVSPKVKQAYEDAGSPEGGDAYYKMMREASMAFLQEDRAKLVAAWAAL